MAEAAFPEVARIPFEGPDSKNPLAFRFYNENEIVEGKTMKDHLRFSVAYWHTMRGTGSDPFGPGTMLRPWESARRFGRKRHQPRRRGLRVHGEARRTPSSASTTATSPPKAATLAETNKNLDAVVKVIKEEMQRTGIKLLWGTANLFSNPRYMHGAATSPNADAFAFAAAQVKKALEVTKELGGAGYTFWGGREGYQTLWNTDMKRELDHLAASCTWPSTTPSRSASRASSTSSPSPRSPPSTSTISTPPPASTSSGRTAWPSTSS